MAYMIGNTRGLYIRLGKTGCPESCNETVAGKFEYSKAKNILDNLPRTQKKFHYKMILVSEFKMEEETKKKKVNKLENVVKEPKSIQHTYYTIPKEVETWADKLKSYNGLLHEAEKRKTELICLLSNVDKEKSNLSHTIRFSKPMNACSGYKMYRQIKSLEDKRGAIKDELEIVSFFA